MLLNFPHIQTVSQFATETGLEGAWGSEGKFLQAEAQLQYKTWLKGRGWPLPWHSLEEEWSWDQIATGRPSAVPPFEQDDVGGN